MYTYTYTYTLTGIKMTFCNYLSEILSNTHSQEEAINHSKI